MAVEAIPSTKGASCAKVVCDDCGRNETVSCGYTRVNAKGTWAHNGKNGTVTAPIESQARANAIKLGWAYVKNKLRCGACEAKRKANNMAVKNVTKLKPKQDAPREPTKRQRIDIFTMLAEVYDIDAGHYMQGDTDDTVANVLGVMPGWVAEIREAEFGPDGGNEDIEELRAKLDNWAFQIDDALKTFTAVKRVIDRLEASGKTMSGDLDKIKKAVGPRVLKKAGV